MHTEDLGGEDHLRLRQSIAAENSNEVIHNVEERLSMKMFIEENECLTCKL